MPHIAWRSYFTIDKDESSFAGLYRSRMLAPYGSIGASLISLSATGAGRNKVQIGGRGEAVIGVAG